MSGKALDLENSEDSSLTFAKKTKRQICRKERKWRREELFKIANFFCNIVLFFLFAELPFPLCVVSLVAAQYRRQK